MRVLDNRWFQSGTVAVAGYAFSRDGKFLEAKALADYFASFEGEEVFAAKLKGLNGCFACVIESPAGVFAAADKIRSIPLFFDNTGKISDHAESIDNLVPQMLEANDTFSEFLITGFVSGEDTLNPNLRQIPAGHYLVYDRSVGAPLLKAYYRYLHTFESDKPESELVRDMHSMHLGVIERLVQSLDGRQAVIPLSGGYDSRLLAYLLKEAGYPKLIAFSYGAKNHPEVRISKSVAKALDIPWFFAEYTHKSWYQAYFSEDRKRYYRHAFNAASSPHIQDWQAVRTLKAQGVFEDDAVFIPGHSADFLQNGHLPDIYAHQTHFTKEELLAQIRGKHYKLWQNADASENAGFDRRIEKVIDIPTEMTALQAAARFEYFDMQERQAKFIVNSLRVYEDLGYAWRLPFWDDAMLDYWLEIPLAQRLHRRLWGLYAKDFLPLKQPIFRDYSIPMRLRNKALRIAFGEIWDVRYGRFAPFESVCQYSKIRVESYLRKDISYPDFVPSKQPLLRSDINALQALRAIYEL